MRRLVHAPCCVVGAGVACFAALGAPAAAAHPLGNFSISHLDTLTFHPDRIVDDAVIDTAEIPTAQAAATVDANGDGTASRGRAGARTAPRSAPAFAGDVTAEVDGAP